MLTRGVSVACGVGTGGGGGGLMHAAVVVSCVASWCTRAHGHMVHGTRHTHKVHGEKAAVWVGTRAALLAAGAGVVCCACLGGVRFWIPLEN